VGRASKGPSISNLHLTIKKEQAGNLAVWVDHDGEAVLDSEGDGKLIVGDGDHVGILRRRSRRVAVVRRKESRQRKIRRKESGIV